jgi:hypothetical protein
MRFNHDFSEAGFLVRRAACLVALALIITACHKGDRKGVPVDPKLVQYLPPGATLLGGADVEKLRSAPFYKRHEDLFNTRAPVKLDQVASLLITLRSNQPVAFLRGDLSNVRPEQSGEAVVRPKPDILILGSRSVTQGGEIPTALKARMDLLPRTDQIWFVSAQGVPIDRAPIRSDVQSALSNISNNIRAFSVGLGVDEGLHLQSYLSCDSEAGAKRVHDAMRGMIGMGRLMTRDDQKDMLKMYDAVEVDQDHDVVRVHADLPEDQADRLVQLLEGFRNKR